MISLIGGGMAAELLHIATGESNRPMQFNPSLVVAAVLFVAITLGVCLYDYYKKKSSDS